LATVFGEETVERLACRHVPDELASPGSRRARLAEVLRQIEVEQAEAAAKVQAKLDAQRADAEQGRGGGGPKPNDPDAAVPAPPGSHSP
jgi:hypothetical protein